MATQFSIRFKIGQLFGPNTEYRKGVIYISGWWPINWQAIYNECFNKSLPYVWDREGRLQ